MVVADVLLGLWSNRLDVVMAGASSAGLRGIKIYHFKYCTCLDYPSGRNIASFCRQRARAHTVRFNW